MSRKYLAKILSSSSPPLHNLDQEKYTSELFRHCNTFLDTYKIFVYQKVFDLVTYFGRKN